MKNIKFILITMLFLTGSLVNAHSSLKSSSPSNEAHLMETPKDIQLEFGQEVRLMKLNLLDKNGDEIKLDFSISEQSSLTFETVIPMIKPGMYKVKWMAMGGDAHKMKGQFTFNYMKMSDSHKSDEDHNHSGNND